MNKLKFIVLVAFLVVSTSSFAQFGKLLDKAKAVATGNTTSLNPSDIATALKQALEQGTSKSADLLSKENGFFGNDAVKILFPPEALKAEATLRKLGLDKMCDDAILSFNRAAEDAAKQAKPIFISAVKNMTVTDAKNILIGSNDAATNYFKTNTTDSLSKVFDPIVEKSIEKVGATKYYSNVVDRYNKIPFVNKINPDLKAYVTQKAIDGLFKEIAQEELKIRENSAFRTTELMQKVFSSVKK
ncbi:MAG: DUF4197 domain-containing protein [Bacteroidetes bacterium]|nr:DUF4197 domain-containing protein [Bacteroidota bacterium]MBU1485494.1 DUF4197 domain-containing protein [Bacteroidota bacterium]MBU2267305.1 DUF4197 domain-containing protein [Bacteroidota bacterium]MBU2376816.1 DUF4197 domain-containing protein [Bacteroidota bacterium]